MYQARVLKLTCEDKIIKLTTCDNIGIRTFCKVCHRLQKLFGVITIDLIVYLLLIIVSNYTSVIRNTTPKLLLIG